MLLGGLWHGANWTFILGTFHGTLLAFERSLGKQSLYHRLPRQFRVGVTFVLVLFSWVLFRSTTLEEAVHYLEVMLGERGAEFTALMLSARLYTQGSLLLTVLCALVLAWPVQAHEWSQEITWPKAILVHPLFCVSLLVMFSQSFNPFLYFQF